MKIFLVALSALALVLSATTTHAADTTPLDVKNNRNLIFFSGFSICDDNVTRDVGLFTFLFHLVTLQVFADIGECEATAPTCAALEAPCMLSTDCCSGLCGGGLKGGGTCEAPCVPGGSCVTSDDCCDPSEFCDAGLASPACSPCLAVDSLCSVNDECCSGICDEGSTCEPPCVPGGSCLSTFDCCDLSQICTGGGPFGGGTCTTV